MVPDFVPNTKVAATPTPPLPEASSDGDMGVFEYPPPLVVAASPCKTSANIATCLLQVFQTGYRVNDAYTMYLDMGAPDLATSCADRGATARRT